MGDIHGAWRALKQCLERAKFNYENDVLIQLGDIVDRYDDVFLCFEELLKVQNLIAIKGNHDDWFERFIETGIHPYNWEHGGEATIRAYSNDLLGHDSRKLLVNKDLIYRNLNIPESHITFLKNQRLYFIDQQQRCFVHGGFDPNIPFFNQSEKEYLWDRNLWISTIECKKTNMYLEQRVPNSLSLFSEIYIGHTSTHNWNSDQPMNAFNIWNLDTGAGFKGRLTIMDIETKAYWQSDLIKDLYDF